ncbi:hypothetical protein [Plantactinospora sp. B5E13]|uniref:hypothetical protein n=1 Tax=unclassified Plantactinospora TaxID=2631981 RepID=UPI00325F3A49
MPALLAAGLAAAACCGCFSDWLSWWQAVAVAAVAPLLVLLLRQPDGRWRIADTSTGQRW